MIDDNETQESSKQLFLPEFFKQVVDRTRIDMFGAKLISVYSVRSNCSRDVCNHQFALHKKPFVFLLLRVVQRFSPKKKRNWDTKNNARLPAWTLIVNLNAHHFGAHKSKLPGNQANSVWLSNDDNQSLLAAFDGKREKEQNYAILFVHGSQGQSGGISNSVIGSEKFPAASCSHQKAEENRNSKEISISKKAGINVKKNE